MTESTVRVALLFPTVLGVYGDGGNIKVLQHRAAARGIKTEVITVSSDVAVPASADLYVLGGGEDDGQIVAAERLREKNVLVKAVDKGAAVFAVCAGMQVIGTDFEVGSKRIVPGVGLLEVSTRRREPRAVGEIWAESHPDLGLPPLSGYENHGGGTVLGRDVQPLGYVTSGVGNGADGIEDPMYRKTRQVLLAGAPVDRPVDAAPFIGVDGAFSGHVLATYMHGPALVRNPALADLLICWATGRDSLDEFDAAYVDELRAERQAYVRSGKLSAGSYK